MDQVEAWNTAASEPPPSPIEAPPAARSWLAPAAVAAVVVGAGAAALAARPKASRHAVPSAPARAADNTLAWAAPALLAGHPLRRYYRGRNLERAQTIEDLRAMAHRRLPRFALEYLEGGGEDEASLARNLAVLREWRFQHRSFVDVSRRDLSTVLFERRSTLPFAIAPTGLNGVFWPHADLQLAEAAAEAGIPFAQSTMSNDRMETVARAPGLRYWWQLYVFGPPRVWEALVDRARNAGCEALILTTDAQIFGNREWQKRTQSSPTELSWSARFNVLGHPEWLARGIMTHGMPRFENVVEFVPKDRRSLFESAHWIRSQMDRNLSWDLLKRIRNRWPRRLIVKGVLCLDEIVRCAELGVDAVAISNHGGRQLDWTVAPLDLLPAAREAVGDRIALIADGGMRRGSDILKALMLGADFVFVGRAPLYGVAAAGREGVKRALDILREELDRDLGLLGAASLKDLDRRLLVRTPDRLSA
ncbi:MAG TPA: alpha-hydroxy acid oxidase [Stellaceae bacterium]|nr:alpha-hydroxy acid oxidase [Stellaceae bacterium]